MGGGRNAAARRFSPVRERDCLVAISADAASGHKLNAKATPGATPAAHTASSSKVQHMQ